MHEQYKISQIHREIYMQLPSFIGKQERILMYSGLLTDLIRYTLASKRTNQINQMLLVNYRLLFYKIAKIIPMHSGQ